MPSKIVENLKLVPRPPIVVVLGHVDHGKTSILDKIRKTRVAEKEAGGITQHIGAYQAESNGRKITFLDTPGHEAFTAIRSRGAKIADIAILVIAADEGVKPQTEEAIAIAKQAKIPFLIALNKIDKEGTNSKRVKQELAEREVFVEGYGGQTPVIEVSAKTGQGIDHLLEMILLMADLENLRAEMNPPAKGVIIESHLDSRRGLVATLLVQSGEIKIGDWISAGPAMGRVKSMEDFTSKAIGVATASQPCVVTGWEIAPRVGDQFESFNSKDGAERKSAESAILGISDIFTTQPNQPKIANFVIKVDVQSSLEAIDQVLKTIKSEEVGCRVVNYGVGNITDADIKNASASKASIIGFHVKIEESAKVSAEREKVTALTFDIIYELVEGVRNIMSELLEPEIRKTSLGKVKILATFPSKNQNSQIIGGRVTQGKVLRQMMIDVYRNGALLTVGRVGQLQQNRVDVPEASEGVECGIRFDPIGKNAPDIKEGDVLEIYQEERVKRTI